MSRKIQLNLFSNASGERARLWGCEVNDGDAPEDRAVCAELFGLEEDEDGSRCSGSSRPLRGLNFTKTDIPAARASGYKNLALVTRLECASRQDRASTPLRAGYATEDTEFISLCVAQPDLESR